MMTSQPDPYATLGLTPGATKDDIAHAYRQLLRRHHPDTRQSGDPAQQAQSDATLSQVIAAYTVLSDDVRRDAHDRGRAGHLEDAGTRSHRPAPESGQTCDDALTASIVAGPVHWTPPRRQDPKTIRYRTPSRWPGTVRHAGRIG